MVPNVSDKEKFALHYENLRLYFKIILRFYRIVEFSQSKWLKQYVEFNISEIIESGKNGNKDEKALYKSMSNAVYSKTMGNLRGNRINTRLIINEKEYLKCTPRPSYMPQKIFDIDLVSVRKIDEPAYVGMCIVDLSKVLIYKLHYDYIKNKHGNNSGLLLTDTDSLMYKIKTKDVYEDFS